MMRLAQLRKRLASRKGAAMEMAIMVTVVTFSLSVLILTTAMLQHSRQRAAKASMAQSIVLEQIGEDFCTAPQNAEALKAKYPAYEITVNGLMLTVTEKDGDRVLLAVVLERADGGYTVTRWNKK